MAVSINVNSCVSKNLNFDYLFFELFLKPLPLSSYFKPSSITFVVFLFHNQSLMKFTSSNQQYYNDVQLKILQEHETNPRIQAQKSIFQQNIEKPNTRSNLHNSFNKPLIWKLSYALLQLIEVLRRFKFSTAILTALPVGTVIVK